MFLESARVRALARASVPRVRALAHASASAITRECTATTRLGGREQRARDSEKRARGRLGGRERRVVSEPDSRCSTKRGSEKIARGRLGEKHGGSEKRTRILEQRVQRSETESAEARRARAKQRNLGRAMACLHTCRARLGTYQLTAVRAGPVSFLHSQLTRPRASGRALASNTRARGGALASTRRKCASDRARTRECKPSHSRVTRSRVLTYL